MKVMFLHKFPVISLRHAIGPCLLIDVILLIHPGCSSIRDQAVLRCGLHRKRQFLFPLFIHSPHADILLRPLQSQQTVKCHPIGQIHVFAGGAEIFDRHIHVRHLCLFSPRRLVGLEIAGLLRQWMKSVLLIFADHSLVFFTVAAVLQQGPFMAIKHTSRISLQIHRGLLRQSHPQTDLIGIRDLSVQFSLRIVRLAIPHRIHLLCDGLFHGGDPFTGLIGYLVIIQGSQPAKHCQQYAERNRIYPVL